MIGLSGKSVDTSGRKAGRRLLGPLVALLAVAMLKPAVPLRAQAVTGHEGTSPDRKEGTVPPGLAALASLAVPGTGQVLQGRKWGWGALVADVALIGGAVWTNAEGRDRTDAYERFADEHWDRQRYLDYLDWYLVQTGEPWPHDHHTLPAEGVVNHDYYEMIGKYDQFAPGWEDWSAEAPSLVEGSSSYRGSYLNDRADANRYLKTSVTAGGLIFLNHALSSAEALIWGIRRERSPLALEVEPERGPRGRYGLRTTVLFASRGSQERAPADDEGGWGAAWRSLLLPGWGQRRQGRTGFANILLGTELLCWGGVLGWNAYEDWRLADSRRWAALHAGADLRNKDARFFEALRDYPDLVTYNAIQLSGLGDPDLVYPEGAGYDWRWDTQSAWSRYRDLRRLARRATNLATLAAGGVVAVRLVGAVSALITARSGGGGRPPEAASPGIKAVPFWQTGLQGNRIGLRLSW